MEKIMQAKKRQRNSIANAFRKTKKVYSRIKSAFNERISKKKKLTLSRKYGRFWKDIHIEWKTIFRVQKVLWICYVNLS